MAIINRTPDSFFDGGKNYSDLDGLRSVAEALEHGADIIDIGGVKSGQGRAVTIEEERDRVVPFIKQVHNHFPKAIISIDTWKSEIAEAAVLAGADIINDAWGGFDPQIIKVAARHKVGLVCTHAGGAAPRTYPHRAAYEDVSADVVRRTTALAEQAVSLGVPIESIMIDPGHDFSKNCRHSIIVTRELDRIAAAGWPVLVAMSNKKFLGEALDLPTNDRLEATLAANVVAAWLGARVFRVHQVKPTRRVLDMVSVIKGTKDLVAARRGLA